MMASVPQPPGDDAVKADFLARLAAEGIILPPDQAGAAASDFLLLHRQMRVIRAAVAPDAPLPLGVVPASDAG